MIKGIGTDIASIKRIHSCIKRYGDNFLQKAFTDAEIAAGRAKANPPIYFAGRWAAKEAFFKALPESCQAVSSWKSIEIVAARNGLVRPSVKILSADLKKRLARQKISRIHLSISHDQEGFGVAFVVME